MLSPRHEDLNTASNLRLPLKKKKKSLEKHWILYLLASKSPICWVCFLLRQRFPADFPQVFGFVCWHTWSCSRCDVDCMVSVDGDFLVGVIVGIVCEHLQRENTALSPEVEIAVRVKSWRFSSDREHGSLTGFLLVSSRVSFHALRKTWTGVKRWWMVVKKGGRANKTGGKSEYLHGLILAVGAQVDWWAVSELDHDAILPRIILRWRQICSPQTSSRSL